MRAAYLAVVGTLSVMAWTVMGFLATWRQNGLAVEHQPSVPLAYPLTADELGLEQRQAAL